MTSFTFKDEDTAEGDVAFVAADSKDSDVGLKGSAVHFGVDADGARYIYGGDVVVVVMPCFQ